MFDNRLRVNQPTPAIVAQSAVRRLPRWALLLFCAAYVLPGFIGRGPWKNADMMAFGYMYELAQGRAAWLAPTLLGQPPEFDALLPYWLGAWAMQLAPGWIDPDFAARLPFIGLLVLTLVATWYGVYYLARTPGAQPVPFAFGGEARPTDYARAVADAGLLALVACLGLMQLSHETTPALAQLGFTALAFYGLAALPYRLVVPSLAIALGLLGLTLSGAPTMAALFALGGAALHFSDAPEDATTPARGRRGALVVLVLAGLAAAVAEGFHAWHWRLGVPEAQAHNWRTLAKLIVWFTWPVWPLALWTAWRWRRQLNRRHVALPIWFALVSVGTTLLAPNPDRALLLSLPAMAALAAFALPTFSRSASALIDWFTLLFFSGIAIFIWVMWIAIQTGFPARPAANVARLAPGFVPSFGLLPFVVALLATVAWVWLVRWRTSRSREAIWKSLVLPAGGTALSWLLATSLWLPVLDYARNYTTVVNGLTRRLDVTGCVEVFGLTRPQIAALRFHGGLDLQPATLPNACPWLVVAQELQPSLAMVLEPRQWTLVATIKRPTDKDDNLLLYRKR
ncbi:MAG: putative rane protein [Ramlibacter sp.]|nr:putative rane protein [Ramlibacter sp.]